MAKIFILLGRRNSGKTMTIDNAATKLGLESKPRKYEDKNFIKWAGFAQEVNSNNQVEVFAEISSPQEQNYESAYMDESITGIKDYAKEWINFLKDKNDAIAIIPFTLCGTAYKDVISMVMEPLKIFEKSNKVEIIYLERKYKVNKPFVQQLINDLNDKIKKPYINSNEEYGRQANELLNHIRIKKVK